MPLVTISIRDTSVMQINGMSLETVQNANSRHNQLLTVAQPPPPLLAQETEPDLSEIWQWHATKISSCSDYATRFADAVHLKSLQPALCKMDRLRLRHVRVH